MQIRKIVFNIYMVIIIIIFVVYLNVVYGHRAVRYYFIVQSESMEPIIHNGSVIFVRPENNYKIGDIITFQQEGDKWESITERIVEVKGVGIEQILRLFSTLREKLII